jgi:hypothetical protein
MLVGGWGRVDLFSTKKTEGCAGQGSVFSKKETDGCANEGYKKVCIDQLLSM